MASRASAAEFRDGATDSDAILPNPPVPVQIGFRHPSKYPSFAFAFDLHSSAVQYSMPFGTKLGARLAYPPEPLKRPPVSETN
jgi:hypothetical protein